MPNSTSLLAQAYRVVKEGGLACIIGPVHPTFWLSRFFADVWMLFPTEAEYMEVESHGLSQIVRVGAASLMNEYVRPAM